jgi:hypothetical protein
LYPERCKRHFQDLEKLTDLTRLTVSPSFFSDSCRLAQHRLATRRYYYVPPAEGTYRFDPHQV